MTAKNKQIIGKWLAILIACLAFSALWLHGRIPQDQSYHAFADRRTLLGTANFMDVISNLPFILVGILGLIQCASSKQKIPVCSGNMYAYQVFFLGVMLIGFGSAYYHLCPDNTRLFWDRLPMTVAFMALFSIILGEFLSVRLGSVLLLPLVLLGILSVVYWSWTESIGEGDLRPYFLVQFLPLLLIPVILVCYSPAFTRISGYWSLIIVYALAKVFEVYDKQVFGHLGVMSGHSIKHIVAAAGIYCLLLSYQHRKRII